MEIGAILIFGQNLPQKGNLRSKFSSCTQFEISTLELGWLPIFMENGASLILAQICPKRVI